jgi:hypothetical protein
MARTCLLSALLSALAVCAAAQEFPFDREYRIEQIGSYMIKPDGPIVRISDYIFVYRGSFGEFVVARHAYARGSSILSSSTGEVATTRIETVRSIAAIDNSTVQVSGTYYSNRRYPEETETLQLENSMEESTFGLPLEFLPPTDSHRVIRTWGEWPMLLHTEPSSGDYADLAQVFYIDVWNRTIRVDASNIADQNDYMNFEFYYNQDLEICIIGVDCCGKP